MKANFKSQKGLTLIELVLTITILAAVAAGFLGLFVTGFKSVATGGDKTTVAFAAQEAAEMIYAGMPVATGGTVPVVTSGPASTNIVIVLSNPSESIVRTGNQYNVSASNKGQAISIDFLVPN